MFAGKLWSGMPKRAFSGILYFIIPLLRHSTILGQKNAQNMPRYYTVEKRKNMD